MKFTFAMAALLASASAVQLEQNKVKWPVFDAETLKFVVPETHPKDYPVPDFGKDHDIISTQNHLKAAEAQHGHTWKPDPEKLWENLPKAHSEKEYTYSRYMVDPEQLGVLIQLDAEGALDYRPNPEQAPWHNPYVGSKRKAAPPPR